MTPATHQALGLPPLPAKRAAQTFTKTIATLAAAALLAGCATRGAGYVPLVDMQGKEDAQFASDLTQCQAYARQRIDAASGAAIGAVAVGILAAVLAPRGWRNEVAGRGALLGGVSGAAGATDTQESITKRCLAGRGYNVLN